MARALEKQKYLTLLEDEAESLILKGEDKKKNKEMVKFTIDKGKVKKEIIGVICKNTGEISAKKVIITTGTYLEGVRLRGNERKKGGPLGFEGSYKLAKSLEKNGISLRRFKTGTPARAIKKTLDIKNLIEQKGDEPGIVFSYKNKKAKKNKISCYLTYTNRKGHLIVKKNLKKSALYGGKTEGIGPRYCLCIEDKIVRFPERERHQVFLEQEGLESEDIYIQGLNINLPKEIQKEFYNTIAGLEKAEFSKYGYTIEYDSVDPLELNLSLESKKIKGLYFAGQVIGSSGYEEAGATGLISGINVALSLNHKKAFVPRRTESYIGVLIDDLITKAPEEPYRIMTSRAEHKLILRQDNADERLSEKGYKIGLLSKKRYLDYITRKTRIEKAIELLKRTRIEKKIIEKEELKIKKKKIKVSKFIKMPESSIEKINNIMKNKKLFHVEQKGKIKNAWTILTETEKERVFTEIKYEGYIRKEQLQIEKMKRYENKKIPKNIDYKKLKGLKKEAIEKLEKLRPKTLGQATRMSGVSPADINILMMVMK
jgi:tRNA uridine 5-carboxymethylaminomethyl modification enzyme